MWIKTQGGAQWVNSDSIASLEVVGHNEVGWDLWANFGYALGEEAGTISLARFPSEAEALSEMETLVQRITAYCTTTGVYLLSPPLETEEKCKRLLETCKQARDFIDRHVLPAIGGRQMLDVLDDAIEKAEGEVQTASDTPNL